MEETIEKIVEFAMKTIKGYGYSDQYYLLEEVCRRLQTEGTNALQMEYFMEEVDDE